MGLLEVFREVGIERGGSSPGQEADDALSSLLRQILKISSMILQRRRVRQVTEEILLLRGKETIVEDNSSITMILTDTTATKNGQTYRTLQEKPQ